MPVLGGAPDLFVHRRGGKSHAGRVRDGKRAPRRRYRDAAVRQHDDVQPGISWLSPQDAV